jgi:hypothetical protein
MACAGSRPQRVEAPQVNGRQSGGVHCMHCWRHVHTENGRTVSSRNCKDLIAACPSTAVQEAAHRNATLAWQNPCKQSLPAYHGTGSPSCNQHAFRMVLRLACSRQPWHLSATT